MELRGIVREAYYGSKRVRVSLLLTTQRNKKERAHSILALAFQILSLLLQMSFVSFISLGVQLLQPLFFSWLA